jgi:hypothetical protein
MTGYHSPEASHPLRAAAPPSHPNLAHSQAHSGRDNRDILNVDVDRVDDEVEEVSAETSTQAAIHNDRDDWDVIDVDKVEDSDIIAETSGNVGTRRLDHGRRIGRPKSWPCEGLLVVFPEGKNHHTSYPFGMHNEHTLPWNYRSTDDSFYIQAKSCQGLSPLEGHACEMCQKLTSSRLYIGIIDRIKFGAHESTPYPYYGVGELMTIARRKAKQLDELRMSKLNDSRKLLVKMGALDDHKQWILAIASGRVDRVASLVQAGLKHRSGIRALVQQYEHAADKLYKPKGYTNKDIRRSIVLLRLGGARVAEFAHRSLSLPSLTTIRRNTVLPALIVSPSKPTVAEIEANILSCYSVFDSREGSTGTDLPSPKRIVHQILMLDELAVERRV